MNGKYKWGERSVILLRKAKDRGMRVSDTGELILQTGVAARGKPCKEGYRVVQFSVDGERTIVSIARAVCFLVHGEPPTFDHVVDHVDGNKLNDHPSNLRWATRSENVRNNKKARKYIQPSDYDARRINACLKACEGVPVEQLECDQPTFVKMLLERQTLKQERDELLAALADTQRIFGKIPLSKESGKQWAKNVNILSRYLKSEMKEAK